MVSTDLLLRGEGDGQRTIATYLRMYKNFLVMVHVCLYVVIAYEVHHKKEHDY